jgi:hypothetical protein
VVFIGIIAIAAASGSNVPQNSPATTSSLGQTATSVQQVLGQQSGTSSGSNSYIPENNSAASPAAQIATPTQQVSAQQNDTLSNDNSYVNSDGNTVHSPAYSDSDTIPAGASAKCNDGTYSFSQHRSGTCSHHGGAAKWY